MQANSAYWTTVRTLATLLVTMLGVLGNQYPHWTWIPALTVGAAVIGIHAIPTSQQALSLPLKTIPPVGTAVTQAAPSRQGSTVEPEPTTRPYIDGAALMGLKPPQAEPEPVETPGQPQEDGERTAPVDDSLKRHEM